MQNQKYDLCVLGGGPGGYVAAIRGAQLGANVALIEEDSLGGTCLNRGCIPTKAYLKHAQLIKDLCNMDTYGIRLNGFEIDWDQMRRRKDTVVTSINQELESLLKMNGVTILKGMGTAISPKCIIVKKEEVVSHEIFARKIILATGSKSILPEFEGLDLPGVITSNEALDLEYLPQRMLIIGGGVIGIEMATIFHFLGVEVTIVEIMETIIPEFDREISVLLQNHLLEQNIEVKTGAKVVKIERDGDQLKSIVISEDSKEVWRHDLVLLAVGREANLKGTEELGLVHRGHSIMVNSFMETSMKDVYAIGDVVGGHFLAHVASAEGLIAAENVMGCNKTMDYSVIPSCIYTIPEVASVGLTEEEALRQGYEVVIGRFPLGANSKALAFGYREGLIKVVSDKKWDQILGVHCMGFGSTDLIAEAALGIKMEVTSTFLGELVHAHPTFSESIMEASRSINNNAIHYFNEFS